MNTHTFTPQDRLHGHETCAVTQGPPLRRVPCLVWWPAVTVLVFLIILQTRGPTFPCCTDATIYVVHPDRCPRQEINNCHTSEAPSLPLPSYNPFSPHEDKMYPDFYGNHLIALWPMYDPQYYSWVFPALLNISYSGTPLWWQKPLKYYLWKW